MASYQEIAPHPALRAFVDRFWVSATEAGAGPRRILPDGCIDLLVDTTRGEHAVVVGTMTRAVVFAPSTPVRIVAVRFRPGGAVPFLKTSARGLTDRMVDCADVGIRWLTPAPLAGFANPLMAVDALQRQLLARLRASTRLDVVVAHAVSSLFGPMPPSIAALGRETGWSRQHLARVFRAHVGIGPKRLARVARLQRAVDDLQRGGGAGLADAAVRLGYFDQAHMARDFRELGGITPLGAAASAGSIFPIRSLFAGG